jgi:hypothetical protein
MLLPEYTKPCKYLKIIITISGEPMKDCEVRDPAVAVATLGELLKEALPENFRHNLFNIKMDGSTENCITDDELKLLVNARVLAVKAGGAPVIELY